MIELITKMTFWLLAAIVLGFIFGWILSRIKKTEKYEIEIESLSGMLSERDKTIETLTVDYEKSTGLLASKIEIIETLEKRLESQKSGDETQESLVANKELLHEMDMLKKRDQEREEELNEFEKVVMKAEETLESHTTIVQDLEKKIEHLTVENEEKVKAIDLYKETIVEFENELKLYTAGKEDSEFVISKDQFVHIEEQLVEYQEEIEALKKINSELRKNVTTSPSTESLKVGKEEEKNLEEGTVVKIFKDTYKKITKS